MSATPAPSRASGIDGWHEIRLLGPMRVRLADGSHVPDREWRTGKNVDLLRWLALRPGEPVPAQDLADGLWPGDDSKARSSLRTAVAQLRRVLGQDSVVRVGDGLALTGCWVDAPVFAQLAQEAGHHLRAARHADAVATALDADALYLDDLPVGEGAPAALLGQASGLQSLRRRLLTDAAEAALELHWWRDAVDFATRVLELDPLAERASRVLMLGHAGLGEVHRALQEYQRCRRVLADELGVDPSPQTQAAHLQVIRPAPAPRVAPGFVGRVGDLAWLQALLGAAAGGAGDAGAPVVLLRGVEGIGRRRLVVTACERAGLRMTQVRGGVGPAEAIGAEGQVLLWRPLPGEDAAELARLLAAERPLLGPVAVVVLLPPAGEAPEPDGLTVTAVRQLRPMLLDELDALVREVVTGPPSPGIVEELHRVSEGVPGRALPLLRDWVTSGRVVATSRGVALAPPPTDHSQDASWRQTLARVLPRLEGDALEVLQLASLLDGPVTPALLAPLLPGPGTDAGTERERAAVALERLVDLLLMRSSSSGAQWRHPLLQDTVRAWLRPATSRRLHRRIAGSAPVPSAVRVGHWLAAGERELACVAAIEAAEACSSRDDDAGARTHLLQVCSLGDLAEAAPDDRSRLFESLGDACANLQRPDEARPAYQQALDSALAAMLPQVPRLRRKLAAASEPLAPGVAPRPRRTSASSVLSGLGAPVALDQLEPSLVEAIEKADRRHDHRRAVEARLQMAAAVSLPRRDFEGVRRWVGEALRGPVDPADRLRAVLVSQVAPVLFGHGLVARPVLEEAARAAHDAEEHLLWWRFLGLRLVVAHDLGDPGVDGLCTQLERHVLDDPADETLAELATIGVRVLAEREELDRAAAVAVHLPVLGESSHPMLDHLACLAAAELEAARGEPEAAAALLRPVVDVGLREGCTLLVPEAAARLVVLRAGSDPAEARRAFETYDDVVGAVVGGPREEFWRRLSRAAVRAAGGDADGAAGACAQAGTLATHHGLQVLAARARRSRADHLRDLARRGGPG